MNRSAKLSSDSPHPAEIAALQARLADAEGARDAAEATLESLQQKAVKVIEEGAALKSQLDLKGEAIERLKDRITGEAVTSRTELSEQAQTLAKVETNVTAARDTIEVANADLETTVGQLRASARELQQANLELRRINAEQERRLSERAADLEAAHAKSDLLLKEMQHRLKNNMQVITSLLSLQASNVPSEHRGMYEDSLRRISTMSLIHEQLNDQSALTDVDFSQYLRRLCKSLEEAYGLSDVAVRVAAAPIGFNLETATPLALVVNEVLSNAFKHAFPDGRSGTIAVALSEQGGHVSLEISDDGIGSGGEIPGGRKRGLGIRLIEAMCRQLQASCAFADHGGTIFRLSFQRPPSPPSP